MENMFYFNEELLPFYLWALGGVLLCVLALLRINYFQKKYRTPLSQKDTSVQEKFNTLQNRLFFGIVGYLFCAVFLIGFMIASIPVYVYGCLLLIVVFATFSNHSKK